MKILEINVNELLEAISKYKGIEGDMIEKVDVADIERQHHPQTFEIGVGGVLTVYYSVDKYAKTGEIRNVTEIIKKYNNLKVGLHCFEHTNKEKREIDKRITEISWVLGVYNKKEKKMKTEKQIIDRIEKLEKEKDNPNLSKENIEMLNIRINQLNWVLRKE